MDYLTADSALVYLPKSPHAEIVLRDENGRLTERRTVNGAEAQALLRGRKAMVALYKQTLAYLKLTVSERAATALLHRLLDPNMGQHFVSRNKQTKGSKFWVIRQDAAQTGHIGGRRPVGIGLFARSMAR